MHLAALATTVRLIPEVIGASTILTLSGLLALVFTMYGVARRYDPDRVARLTLCGSTVGCICGVAYLVIALISN